eukprot:TRINITY_DN33581_c0_g1_i1.p1 TRINITY_DN33581_c0_g1~~TRINITY_DN33581_c0_g1_i1.p1  ORF type:complete len:381 (+),score=82.91 TRINITY_DN33581_c0_g1_i1:37-1179(+)
MEEPVERVLGVLENVSRENAERALRLCRGDVDRAIMAIMEGELPASPVLGEAAYEPLSNSDTDCSDSDSADLDNAYDTTPTTVSLNPDKDPCEYDPDNSFLPPVTEQLAVIKHCDRVQQEVLRHVVKSSKKRSEAAYPELLLRVKSLNFTEQHLKRCLKYIRDEAPIIIHVSLDQAGRLKKMLHDTHYRNQFETGTSNGTLDHTTRKGWEARLFNNIYDENSVRGFQRPKYGCLNVVKDPFGIAPATQYGDSYLELKAVRLRCSFVDQDSSSTSCELACCEWYAHVCNAFTKAELKALLQVGNGILPFEPSSCISTYKEVQIHGEICLSQNIERVVVAIRHKKHPNIIKDLKEFCKKYGCTYVFMDDLKAQMLKAHREKS